MKKLWIFALLLAGCAGLDRGCSSWSAQSFGADWVVVQQRMTDGVAYNCWILQGVSISNETSSDGVYWKDGSGHLIHIAGQYARVQVNNSQFKTAARLIGVDADKCRGGVYPSADTKEE
jgi:hypothetical protein